MHIYKILFSSVSFLVLCSCGGGSSESGVLFEGQLTQGEVAEHSATVSFRHGENQPIEEVEVCALGECSRTDGEGQWGFVASEGFTSGPVLFSIQGHGIDAQTAVDVPDGANEVLLHFENQGEHGVVVHHMYVDGQEVHEEEAGEEHEEPEGVADSHSDHEHE